MQGQSEKAGYRNGKPVRLYRLIHKDSLPTLLTRRALHAPNCTPDDGLPYRTIHKATVQSGRHERVVQCGPGGTLHDYVPFYFGPLSVMLLNLKTGRVPDYNEGQRPLIYLTTTVPAVVEAGVRFIFSDGHGLASFTSWFDDIACLDMLDWDLIPRRYWADTPDDNDRQRRKQAEFLIWQSLAWADIETVGVLNPKVKSDVEDVLGSYPDTPHPPVAVHREWYY